MITPNLKVRLKEEVQNTTPHSIPFLSQQTETLRARILSVREYASFGRSENNSYTSPIIKRSAFHNKRLAWKIQNGGQALNDIVSDARVC